MSDIRLTNQMNANGNVETEHATATAGGASDGSLYANNDGASYSGSTSVDATYAVDPPPAPEVPNVGGADVVADATATADATVNDVFAHVDAAAEAVGNVGAPELPELPDVGGSVDGGLSASGDAAVDGTSVGLDAMLDGWLDVMGDLVVQFSGSVTALLGF